LAANQRVLVENVAAEQEAVRREDRDALAAALHRNRTANTEVAPAPAKLLNARLLDQLHKRLPAAVQDRHLQVVDLDEGVVDTHAVEHAEQVFGGGDENALPHQTGGVADLLHVAPARRDVETVKVG